MKKISAKDYIFIASMLFGLFFGAGNLIFPAYLGQMSGKNFIQSAAGFLTTGVGLPLLGIIAMGISQSSSLMEMAGRVSKKYAFVFTIALYLTIGPFFAIPRTATVSFSVGIEPLLNGNSNASLFLVLFSFVFFAIALFFSLRPSKIMTWVGKILNPIFLVLLGILVVTAIINPMGNAFNIEPSTEYATQSYFKGFMEGYNTMDALASLAFGIVVINVIKGFGVESPSEIAVDTMKSGLFSMILMAAIYAALILIGAQSRGIMEVSSNGGVALARIAEHYFGKAGAILLAAMITFACLKTSIGLITSCSEMFSLFSKNKIDYKTFAVIFSIVSFAIANLGLNKIIEYSIPVLMLLYPLVITIILLSITGKLFSYSPYIFRSVTLATFIAACFDFLNALPANAKNVLHVNGLISFAGKYLPFFSIGMGWILPAAVGLAVGVVLFLVNKNKQK